MMCGRGGVSVCGVCGRGGVSVYVVCEGVG